MSTAQKPQPKGKPAPVSEQTPPVPIDTGMDVPPAAWGALVR
ncbi:MAG: hypothetical protein AAGA78_20125 [Pseudomonadota bacterium]